MEVEPAAGIPRDLAVLIANRLTERLDVQSLDGSRCSGDSLEERIHASLIPIKVSPLARDACAGDRPLQFDPSVSPRRLVARRCATILKINGILAQEAHVPHRELKDPLYTQFARIGHAVASPVRIELLDLLAQGEKTVETLAEQSGAGVKNTSAHLRVLRQARLVDTRRAGTYVYYRLADDEVSRFMRDMQRLGRRRLAEVEQVARQYLDGRDELEPVTVAELRKLVRDGGVTVIDVRPRGEYEAGHIPGAVSIPVAELKQRLRELPKRREIIAYCRGPYCVFAVEAVTLLRKSGFKARRSEEGWPAWKDSGQAVETGP